MQKMDITQCWGGENVVGESQDNRRVNWGLAVREGGGPQKGHTSRKKEKDGTRAEVLKWHSSIKA
jgi:hypothetical protein